MKTNVVIFLLLQEDLAKKLEVFEKGELQLSGEILDHFSLLETSINICNVVLNFDHCRMLGFVRKLGGNEREGIKEEGKG